MRKARQHKSAHTSLPPPPHARLHSTGAARHVLLRLMDGRRIRGAFVSVDVDAHTVRLQNVEGGEEQAFSLSAVKLVVVDDPCHWHVSSELLAGETELDVEPSITSFEIRFVDDDQIRGKTLGFRVDTGGFYLYPLRSEGRITQCFVPHEAIKSQQIGEMTGEALVFAGLVRQDSVDTALSNQKRDREERLGELLGKHAIVTATELERALMTQDSTPNRKIGEILVHEGLISEDQLTETLSLQQAGRHKPLGELLVEADVVTERELHGALARKLGIPQVDLEKFIVDKDVFDTIPAAVLNRHRVVPLYQFDGRLVVAMSDPLDVTALRDLRFSADCHIDPVLAESSEIERLISVMKTGNQVDLNDLETDLEEDLSAAALSSEVMTHSNSLVVRLLNKIIVGAIYNGASDIHLEPQGKPGQTLVRERVDGRLHDTLGFPSRLHRAVIARLKVMAAMDVTEMRKPQDGQIALRKFGISDNSLRVATIPTRSTVSHGEDAVIRIIGGALALKINSLGLSRDNETRVTEALRHPSGMILATGPTGSGKSTTLHALLSYLNTPEKKIWTVEDPVEITQDSLRQVQVAPEVGLTFDSALRSLLRLDPDIIMVGEIRDSLTAQVCVSAALTGHLVLSTLHTNGAAETVNRLLEMDLVPFDFADSLLAAMTQRLTRKVCVACAEYHTPSEKELDELVVEYARDVMQVDRTSVGRELAESVSTGFSTLQLATPRGCKECHQTGFKGLIALHELLVTSPQLKSLIASGSSTREIRQAAVGSGMKTLRQDGLLKVLGGLTTLDELRVCLGPVAVD